MSFLDDEDLRIDDWDDDEDFQCPECGATMTEHHEPTCMYVDDEDDDGG